VESGFDIQWRPPAQFVTEASSQPNLILITGIFRAPATVDQPILWVQHEGQAPHLFGYCPPSVLTGRRMGQICAASKVKQPGLVLIFAKNFDLVSNQWEHAVFVVPVETNLTIRKDDQDRPSSSYKVDCLPQRLPDNLLALLLNMGDDSASVSVRRKKRKLDENSSANVGYDPMQIDIATVGDMSILPPNAHELYQEIIVAREIYAQQYRKFSDQRLKTAIEPIQGALPGLVKLRGVSYLWNSLVKGSDGKRVYGLIAQEVQQYFPHAVRESNGTLTVDYTDLIGVIVEALKELNSDVGDLRKLAHESSARLDDAELRLDRLEKLPKSPIMRDVGVPSKRDRILKSPDLARALDLIRGQSGDIRISLVGSGGMGKSTLARQLIDEDAVRSRFQSNIIWLSLVAEDSAQSALKKLLNLTGALVVENEEASILQQRIRDCLTQPTLMVVDNVWDPAIVFALVDCGFKGLIATTRQENICYDLTDCCLSLFDDRFALQFFPEEDRAPVEPTDNSKAIQEIIARCKGLPLALSVVSRSRKSSLTLSWASVARNLSTFMKSDRSNSLYAAFETSFNNLSEVTRRRLEIVAVFPKGQVRIHHLAIAWNLATSDDSLSQIRKHPEDLMCPGSDLFELAQNSLITCSFIAGCDQKLFGAQVHDLFHDYLRDHLSGAFLFRRSATLPHRFPF
jgi:hypothetical protein